MLQFGIEVRSYNPRTNEYEWEWLRLSGSIEPYRFNTGDEAHQIKAVCYPGVGVEWVRVKQFPEEN